MVRTSEFCPVGEVGRGHPPGLLSGSVRDQDSGFRTGCAIPQLSGFSVEEKEWEGSF